jgi:hypothetical protein
MVEPLLFFFGPVYGVFLSHSPTSGNPYRLNLFLDIDPKKIMMAQLFDKHGKCRLCSRRPIINALNQSSDGSFFTNGIYFGRF